jgi:hypothetical protein
MGLRRKVDRGIGDEVVKFWNGMRRLWYELG